MYRRHKNTKSNLSRHLHAKKELELFIHDYVFLFFQLDDTKRLADAEQRDRATLLGKFRNLVRKGNHFPNPNLKK